MQTPIILLGPHQGGKTTVGKLLAETLHLPLVQLGEISRPYWDEIGFQEAERHAAWEQARSDGVYQYMLPYHAHALIRAIHDQPGCILEVGSIESVFDDPEEFRRVRDCLAPLDNVILFLPSDDVESSVGCLELRGQVLIYGVPLDELFVKHRS